VCGGVPRSDTYRVAHTGTYALLFLIFLPCICCAVTIDIFVTHLLLCSTSLRIMLSTRYSPSPIYHLVNSPYFAAPYRLHCCVRSPPRRCSKAYPCCSLLTRTGPNPTVPHCHLHNPHPHLPPLLPHCPPPLLLCYLLSPLECSPHRPPLPHTPWPHPHSPSPPKAPVRPV
jgi:hypothetical protein